MRTADSIEEQSSQQPVTKKKGRGGWQGNKNSLKGLKPWPKGVSGNPSGLPGCDMGAVIARHVLEQNKEAIYAGLSKVAAQGNAYAFKELCERGYGKLTERREVSVEVTVTDKLLNARKRLLEKRNGNSDTTDTIQ